MSWTPSASSARPLSTFRNGTTCFSLHRYSAEPRPSISRSIVISNRIAPRMRSPLKAGLVMMRVRISWIRSNISSSPEYASSGDAVQLQRLRGAAAALVERGDEALPGLGLLELLLVHDSPLESSIPTRPPGVVPTVRCHRTGERAGPVTCPGCSPVLASW